MNGNKAMRRINVAHRALFDFSYFAATVKLRTITRAT